MTQEEILEGNKIIAEFLCNDFTNYVGTNQRYKWQLFNKDCWYEERDLLFHSSWGWLMPVITKIRCNNLVTNVNYNFEGDFIIEGLTKKEILNIIINREDFKSDLEMCYFGTVEFIKWYNFNKE